MNGLMKKIVYYGKRDLRMEEHPIPQIGPKDVLLESGLVSICGTDLHPYRTGRFGREKQVFGHEYSATIAEVGPEVTKYKVGDRVFGANFGLCGKCYYCKKGDYARCLGVLDNYTGQGQEGALSQYWVFKNPEDPNAPAPHMNSLLKIPDHMTDVQCAMMEPFGVGLGAVQSCDIQEGDQVVILGAGAIGNSAMQWVKAKGAVTYVVDVSERRLSCAKACGADYIIDNSKGDCYEQIAALTTETGWSQGSYATTVATVIDCAGYPGSFNDALKIVRPQGTVCDVALTEESGVVDAIYVTYKGLKIFGTTACDVKGAMQGILNGTVKVEPLIDEIIPKNRYLEAFDRQMDASAVKVLIDMRK